MNKHTPGPWYRDFASGMKNGNAILLEYFVRRDGDDMAIAADIVDPATGNPSEANARLIAAAPDLLAALQGLLKGIFDGPDEANAAMLIAKARDAVSKAMGEK